LDKVIVIAGPTASGKTALGIRLAEWIGGEVISADSMQVYKYMDIGTAKPTLQERKGIKHYLIDEVTPDQEFSVAKFQAKALEYIKEITNKGLIPIIVGGTGLYINSLIHNIQYAKVPVDYNYRERLKTIAGKESSMFLHDELKKIDVEAAGRIHPNDLKRVIRALEIYDQTGINMSSHIVASRLNPSEYSYIMLCLKMDRQRLYFRINERSEEMFKKGLIDEVRNLMKLGYSRYSTAMQGLGYKEAFWFLDGQTTIEETIELLKRNTRRYAKRQMTWFKKMKEIKWFDAGDDDLEISKNVYNYIETYSGIL